MFKLLVQDGLVNIQYLENNIQNSLTPILPLASPIQMCVCPKWGENFFCLETDCHLTDSGPSENQQGAVFSKFDLAGSKSRCPLRVKIMDF